VWMLKLHETVMFNGKKLIDSESAVEI